MLDTHGRSIDYIRISITDRCNLRCVYCMPEDGVSWYSHADVLSFEEILRLCRILAGLGVRKVKVTGGEPLVRKGAVGFVRSLKAIDGIEQVTLTTNGVLLADYIHELAEAGLGGVNISLDTLDEAAFARLTRKDSLKAALDAIELAYSLGVPVKVNCVPIMGQNDTELARIAALARDKDIHVRFIELMPVGLGDTFSPIEAHTVVSLLEREYGKLVPFVEKLGNGPAKYYTVGGFKGKIGFISAVSHEFCGSCNRLRLTSDGQLKACLAYDTGIDVKKLLRGEVSSDDDIRTAVVGLVSKKPAGHNFSEKRTNGSEGRAMFRIGG